MFHLECCALLLPDALMDASTALQVDEGTALYHFSENEELLSLVCTLPQVYAELRTREKSEERFTGRPNTYSTSK